MSDKIELQKLVKDFVKAKEAVANVVNKAVEDVQQAHREQKEQQSHRR